VSFTSIKVNYIMPISKERHDGLIKNYINPEDLLGEQGLLKKLTKAILERAMQAELMRHPVRAKRAQHAFGVIFPACDYDRIRQLRYPRS